MTKAKTFAPKTSLFLKPGSRRCHNILLLHIQVGCDKDMIFSVDPLPPETDPYSRAWPATWHRALLPHTWAAIVDFFCGADTYRTCTLGPRPAPWGHYQNSEESSCPQRGLGVVSAYIAGLILSVLSWVEGHCVLLLLLSVLCYMTLVRPLLGWDEAYIWQ